MITGDAQSDRLVVGALGLLPHPTVSPADRMPVTQSRTRHIFDQRIAGTREIARVSLVRQHNYDGVVFGRAPAGNLHFVITSLLNDWCSCSKSWREAPDLL